MANDLRAYAAMICGWSRRRDARLARLPPGRGYERLRRKTLRARANPARWPTRPPQNRTRAPIIVGTGGTSIRKDRARPTLTGIDSDRPKEEKERAFDRPRLDHDPPLRRARGIVDVRRPDASEKHVAGATGIDVVLMVVAGTRRSEAADEGASRHRGMLRSAAGAALTKATLAPERIARAREEVAGSGGPARGSPIFTSPP